MTAPAFIHGLRERGATLQIEGETLCVTPSTALTDADRAAWREHKREIIALLESASQSSTQPRECWPGALFDPTAAIESAHIEYSNGNITTAQRDALLSYSQSAQILSLISGTAGKTEPTTATTEVDHGI